MVSVAGLLATATIVQLLMALKNPHRDYHELYQRIMSWWWITGLLFGFLYMGKNAAIVFFAFVSFLALREFMSILPTRQADRNVLFWAYLSIPLQYYWVGSGWYGMFIIFIPVYMFLFIPMRMVFKGETDGFIKAAGVIHWAVMLTVFSISHIAFLLVLPDMNVLAGGVGLVLYLLFITQFNDINQYIWGKLFGKHKITPKVSPNKTWEGFLGGLLTITLIAGFIAPFLTPLTRSEGFLAGLIISVGGFIGDVVISAVKRDLKIKDSGHLIPGHGGVLDRMDSLIYTAPLFFHYIYYLHY
ncbi:Phosphatidate cytidylyltransferase [hydrothermal vent metagenome]|uniref:Phosphatidate cytidylyltransferase n=1 Tax=hydrothermal vent metagenome TaxID=652676 RepID=A0A3B0XMX1_9ZZZZ